MAGQPDRTVVSAWPGRCVVTRTDVPLDPYLPQCGNTGYRVSQYDLDLTYKVVGNRLSGTATIALTVTDDRDRFAFDLGDTLHVAKVSVEHGPDERSTKPVRARRKAKFTHRAGKLVVTLPGAVDAGTALRVAVHYAGRPRPIRSRWGEVGWEELTGGSIVASQPNGASSWFPCNDHPSSKAPYRMSITTDSPFTAVANGTLVGRTTRASRTTWVYEQPQPMASYLATIQIGHYDAMRAASDPVPITVFHPARLRREAAHDFDRQSRMLAIFGELFGEYPFPAYSVVVTDDELEIPVEAQGLSIFGSNHCDGRRGSERLVAHELAHQWFGNSVTLGQWRDIWLHEGFACYAEWLWSENSRGASAAVHASHAHARLTRLPQDIVVGDPGPDAMFDDRVYKRGALALHALRAATGDDAFFGLLRAWTSENRYGTVDTDGFVALAQQRTDTPIRPLVDAWLYSAPLPSL
ncbi:M1 family metallopeptidase [Rhodococcus sp. HNM0569]|uniref:M1 family metallopeptidase n=1 Tax=Rhodococcus sp. HNM0569 TaxID=2716340 RepID=UPI00146F291C|nr:M1 family metallopeptidase [Rhodococcus sp. HNM0569]NLU82070.1 M1 family metallopeptidase [Rhodococcus sp. HNM0569]